MNGLVDALVISVGGGVGAAARFWLADTIKARRPDGFPWGTWVVNVLGALFIGIVTGVLTATGVGERWHLLVAVGVAGGFTTFSTTVTETALMIRRGRPVAAAVHALSTMLASVLAVVAGLALMHALL